MFAYRLGNRPRQGVVTLIGGNSDSVLDGRYNKVIILYHMVVGLGYPYAIEDLEGSRTVLKVSHFPLALDVYALDAKKSGGTPMTSFK